MVPIRVESPGGTIDATESQAKHHRKRTFQEEFLAFLKEHNMEYDGRYVCG
jgi:hypothetical protein